MTRALLAVAALTVVYALALASVDPLDLALGFLLSSAVVIGLRRFLFPGGLVPIPGLAGRLFAGGGLVVSVVRDVVVGTWEVALLVLGLRPLRSPGIVELPIDDRSDLATVVAALTATLSPGELVVDFDWERRVVLMHVLDASDGVAVRARWHENYERFQKAVVP